MGADEFLAQLTRLREEIAEHTAELVSSDRVNHWDEKQGFLAILERIISRVPKHAHLD